MPSLIERFEVDPARRLAAALQEPRDHSRAVPRESTLMSTTENPSLVGQEPSSFEVAVRDRSWDWLLELRRRLKVDLLLVDSRPLVLLPTLTDQAARLSAMLEHGEGALLTAISASLRERTSQTLDLGGLQIICVPVIMERNAGGALLVGRVSPSRQDAVASRSQLEFVASWLTAAVDAHLLSPPAFQSSGLNRVAPLAQLLGQASARESDRELIRLFGEAIAVWHDIEVSGYVETTAGVFARDVTLPGMKKGERPAVISSVGLPDSTDLVRLPQGHLDRFGLPVNDDVFVRRFKGKDGRSWLMVFTGEIGAYDLQRIGAYVALLDLALLVSTSAFTARITRTIAVSLATIDVPETQAARALEELRAALGAAAATLTIESSSGVPAFSITAPAGASDVHADASAFRLVLVKRSERHYTTTLSLGRNESLQFTPRDHAAANAAVSDVRCMGTGGSRKERVRVSSDARHRADSQKSFERSAREALERGAPDCCRRAPDSRCGVVTRIDAALGCGNSRATACIRSRGHDR